MQGMFRQGFTTGPLANPRFARWVLAYEEAFEDLTVTAFWPTSGRTTGGQALVITGVGFVNGCTVDVAGLPATGVVFVDSTRVTCNAPAHDPGTGVITVTNPDSHFGSRAGFTYYTPAASDTQLVASHGGVDPQVRRDTTTVNLAVARGTATFKTADLDPAVFTAVRIGLGSLADADLIFRGRVQQSDQEHEDDRANKLWTAGLVDSSAEFNRYLAWGDYDSIAADVIALDLLSKSGSDFTGVNIQSGLPLISLTLTGELMDDVFRAIAKAIGGYYFRDNSYDVHLTLDPTAAGTPDILDDANTTLLNDPPLKWSASCLQTRNRDIGIGANTQTLAPIAPGDTSFPAADTTIFDPAGVALVRSQRISYTGKQSKALQGGPSDPPMLAIAAGAGLSIGDYEYSSSDVTAAGESIPGPIAAIVVAGAPAPQPLLADPVLNGGSNAGTMDIGAFKYGLTETVGGGEGLPTALSVAVTTAVVPDPVTAPSVSLGGGTGPNGTYYFKFAYADDPTPTHHSNSSPASGPITAAFQEIDVAIPAWNGTAGVSTPVVVLISYNGVNFHVLPSFATPGTTWAYTGAYDHSQIDAMPAAPSSNNFTGFREVALSLPTPSPFATTQTLYRTAANGSQLKVLFVRTTGLSGGANYFDVLPDASLGANAPTVSAAHLEQVTYAVKIGPSGTTARNVYRTVVNGSQAKLLHQIADNTTVTPITDSAADGTLGVNAPTVDTSGLLWSTFVGPAGVFPPNAVFNTSATGWLTTGHLDNGATAAPVFTDAGAGYTFVTADIGASLYIKAGTNTIPGFYKITGLSSGNAVLAGPCATVNTTITVTWGVNYATQTSPRYTMAGTLDLSHGDNTKLGWSGMAGSALDNHLLGNSIWISGGTGFVVQQVTIIGLNSAYLQVSGPCGTLSSTGGSGFLGQVVNVVQPGVTTFPVGDDKLLAAGGWLSINGQLVQFSSASGGMALGVPATGNGSVVAPIPYFTAIVPVASLFGIPPSGAGSFTQPVLAGSSVSLYAERNDLDSQALVKAVEGGSSTGVYEFKLTDTAVVSQAALNALCDADLALYADARGIITVAYSTSDRKSTVGAPVVVNKPLEGLVGTFVIQSVTISAIDQAENETPVYACVATSVLYSMDDVIRHMTLRKV